MAARVRFRDAIRSYLPPWLADRVTSGKTGGFRFLWAMVAPLDAATDYLVQGLVARYPGLGHPSALPYIGRSRGVVRGRLDTDATYAAKLLTWIDRKKGGGQDERLLREIADYLGTAPRIRLFRRKDGACVTLETDGTISRVASTAWDWDSVSHPERSAVGAPFWSDFWLVVYAPPYAIRPGDFAGITADQFALGHLVPLSERDELGGILSEYKSAHSCIRAVIWTTDATLFNPAAPATMPDGTWGAWSSRGSGARVGSGRNYTTCRYWEPRRDHV
jgi:hypothetical protein